MGKIFSPGKLLLTSEYVVLDGALALAVPTKLGQEFFFEEVADEKSIVVWEALHQNQPWLKVVIDYQNWTIIETNNSQAGEFVVKVLRNVQEHSLSKFKSNFTYHLKTNLQFPSDYGWGSSSTLMNNIAEWAQMDPFLLNEISLGGSGYDIAVAKEKSAILYQINGVDKISQKVNYKPSFSDELLLVHLNKKQDSREGIMMYRSKKVSEDLIQEFSKITNKILQFDNIEEFSSLMELHEKKLSNLLGISTVKEKYFESMPVFVKSLGAWGGDFVLTRSFEGSEEWFLENNFKTVLKFNSVVD